MASRILSERLIHFLSLLIMIFQIGCCLETRKKPKAVIEFLILRGWHYANMYRCLAKVDGNAVCSVSTVKR